MTEQLDIEILKAIFRNVSTVTPFAWRPRPKLKPLLKVDATCLLPARPARAGWMNGDERLKLYTVPRLSRAQNRF